MSACLRRVAGLTLVAAGVAGCGHGQNGDLFSQGRHIFTSAGCGSCHTVASAHTHGTEGPDFDTSEQLDRRQIRAQLNLGEGGMPSFRHRLTAQQEQAVTEFVFQTMHARRALVGHHRSSGRTTMLQLLAAELAADKSRVISTSSVP